jgi:hypothetical protein
MAASCRIRDDTAQAAGLPQESGLRLAAHPLLHGTGRCVKMGIEVPTELVIRCKDE